MAEENVVKKGHKTMGIIASIAVTAVTGAMIYASIEARNYKNRENEFRLANPSVCVLDSAYNSKEDSIKNIYHATIDSITREYNAKIRLLHKEHDNVISTWKKNYEKKLHEKN